MKVLITGGAGFIGSNFIRYYMNKHPETKIVNLDNLGRITLEFPENLIYLSYPDFGIEKNSTVSVV